MMQNAPVLSLLSVSAPARQGAEAAPKGNGAFSGFLSETEKAEMDASCGMVMPMLPMPFAAACGLPGSEGLSDSAAQGSAPGKDGAPGAVAADGSAKLVPDLPVRLASAQISLSGGDPGVIPSETPADHALAFPRGSAQASGIAGSASVLHATLGGADDATSAPQSLTPHPPAQPVETNGTATGPGARQGAAEGHDPSPRPAAPDDNGSGTLPIPDLGSDALLAPPSLHVGPVNADGDIGRNPSSSLTRTTEVPSRGGMGSQAVASLALQEQTSGPTRAAEEPPAPLARPASPVGASAGSGSGPVEPTPAKTGNEALPEARAGAAEMARTRTAEPASAAVPLSTASPVRADGPATPAAADVARPRASETSQALPEAAQDARPASAAARGRLKILSQDSAPQPARGPVPIPAGDDPAAPEAASPDAVEPARVASREADRADPAAPEPSPVPAGRSEAPLAVQGSADPALLQGALREPRAGEAPAGAPPPSAPMAPPMPQTAQAHDIAIQIGAHLPDLADRPVELILAPEELGHVKLSLHDQDGTMMVTITADRADTLDLMRRHADTLVQDFREMGFGDISFSFSQRRDGENARETAQAFEDPDAPRPSYARQGTDTLRIALGADSGLDLRM